jgi:4-hydroxybenzoate polyprenyltransferase
MTLSSYTGVKTAPASLRTYLACVRYGEVLLLQGPPLFGAAFALRELRVETVSALALFLAASVLLVAHIWTLNDWAGLAADLNDPNRSARVFSRKGVRPRGLLRFSIALLVASLLLFSLLSHRTLVIAVAIAALGVVYSYPPISAKSRPVASSLAHLLGGTLHFLLGYSIFEAIDPRAALISLFFGLTFTAGHLNQEVRDYDGDRRNALRTNAVTFGKATAFLAGFVIFTLAYADLAALALARVVPPLLAIPPLLLYPLHVAWTVGTFRTGLSFEGVSKFQSRYRALFALIGLSMVAALLCR